MDLSNQLRIILLLAGVVVWAAIYFLGKRRAGDNAAPAPVWNDVARPADEPDRLLHDEPVLDEEELEVPAYLRRQKQEGRVDMADAIYEDEQDELQHIEPVLITDEVDAGARDEHDEQLIEPESSFAQVEPDQFQMGDMRFEVLPDEPTIAAAPVMEPVAEPVIESVREPATPLADTTQQVEAPVAPAVSATIAPDAQPVRSEQSVRHADPAIPTLSETAVSASHAPTAASTISATPSGTTPSSTSTIRKEEKPASPASRRKIIALRLAFPERVSGVQLLELLQSERMTHGKFSIYHRLHDGGTVFSLASMVEPGAFDVAAMPQQQFPGVTLFMLLPGPLDGLIAYDQMLSSAQRLAHATHGILQDERGSKLTAQIMERLRDEVLDFQHLIGGIAQSG
jgi:FtsZ-interacting cell division protein ZipA